MPLRSDAKQEEKEVTVLSAVLSRPTACGRPGREPGLTVGGHRDLMRHTVVEPAVVGVQRR